MTIQYSKVPAIYQALQEASKDEKLWLAFDSRIQMPSVHDLHFFDTESRAIDFKHYHGLQGKEISLLPVEATRYFLHEATRSRLQDGVPSPSIELDANAINSIHQEMVFNFAASMLEESMDTFDWSRTFYDPLEANTEADRIEDKINFNRLEFLVEQLSAFAGTSDRANAFVAALLERHWKDRPMEVQIKSIVNGNIESFLLQKNIPANEKINHMRINKKHAPEIHLQMRKEMAFGNAWCYLNVFDGVLMPRTISVFRIREEAIADKQQRDWLDPSCLSEPFPVSVLVDQLRPFVEMLEGGERSGPMQLDIKQVNECMDNFKGIIHLTNKTETMNTENLEYLQKQLLFTGFGEGLNTQLERRIKEGLPDFQLQATHEFGKDKMEAVLHFAKSKQDGSDMYFFNKYDATLHGQNGTVNQTFYINNKGKSVRFDEAANLMNGRSVYKEVTPKEGAAYKAWIKIDFANKDEHGNFKLNYFNANYGFNLAEAVGRLPLKELGNPDKMEALYSALQRGELAQATLIKGGREINVQLAADPKFKTLKMFDSDGVKLFVPGPKQEAQYGQAPADEKKQTNGQQMEVGQPLENGNAEKSVSQNGVNAEEKEIKKKDLLPKKAAGNDLMPKNRVRKGKGVGIA